MGRIVVSGPIAQLRWGYQIAADLTDWRFDGEFLSAAIVRSDAFRMTQSGLVFVVIRNGQADAARPVLSHGITDGRLTACLGLKRG